MAGNTKGTSDLGSVSTKQARIAELAKQLQNRQLVSLNHYLDLEWMQEACRLTRKNKATGVDGVTWQEYSQDLEVHLKDLLDRAKSGDRYRAPCVRRTYIPKGNGETRPIGIPTLEDKILQRAVVMVLEPIYEQEFLPCSYGFRPNRSAHQAVQEIWDQIMRTRGCWLIDADLRKYYDTLVKSIMRELLSQRVGDGVIRRLVSKWLEAGVWEEGVVTYPETGTPQGGVISPMLSNIYLHYGLDFWFEDQVKPRLKGRAWLVRFADDFVMGFELEEDAQRVYRVLFERMAKYGLTLHPEKTRLMPFFPPEGRGPSGETFDFLGFTHYWGKSRRGKPVVKRKTMSERLTRALKNIWEYCRKNRTKPLEVQRTDLDRKMRGHYQFYGITGNFRQLHNFAHGVERIWRFWLNRRSRKRDMPWGRFKEGVLGRFPLPPPRIPHSVYT